MRLIHTADWHIGQTLNGWTREAEHRAFLARLCDVVEEHAADVLVVAGDVFDGINPSGESLQMLYEGLVALRGRRPRLTTVMVAGNHDPAGRLEAPAAVLRAIGVHVVGVMHRREGVIDMDRHLVPLADATGSVRAHLLAIPFLRAADLPGLGVLTPQDDADGEAGSPVVRATRRLYAEATAAALGRAQGLPLLATGHLHCSGAAESEGAERRILVGGEHAVPPDVFPADLAYVALGHLHKPQAVGRASVRYSGSPFPLSATELPYEHGVTLVEIGDGGVRSEHIRLARPVPCLRVPETGALTLPALEGALAALGLDPQTPVELRPFVHVVVAPEGSVAGLSAEVERVLQAHPVRCAGVRVERPAATAAGPDAALPVVPLAERSPVDLFARAFEAEHGSAPTPRHMAAFHDAETEG
ncbi:MAG: exonuclease SbcCD subunit D [Burkholderiales bacterium]|nr:exonuclease SbcCD subunit D [Burkholderiales bacterium]